MTQLQSGVEGEEYAEERLLKAGQMLQKSFLFKTNELLGLRMTEEHQEQDLGSRDSVSTTLDKLDAENYRNKSKQECSNHSGLSDIEMQTLHDQKEEQEENPIWSWDLRMQTTLAKCGNQSLVDSKMVSYNCTSHSSVKFRASTLITSHCGCSLESKVNRACE
ncbi:hypothetical protein CAPTEDRAFT_189928 [Capitella teleta]|uniref:Uncharacterized protein n=1 Tax=Capitella teleta TaxID=283909 RepID=R7UPM2_CAPTE|nr:hypothetical protein CAPTEDRAFT_189928 [Capitella teleta]|eukprot:ELU05376.1 hypothetical protein CAPTEDRAFT_189928 [Capitella teleta]